MTKKIFAIITLLSIVLCFSGCSGEKKEELIKVKPEKEQIQSICELATLDCYYHNVARSTKEAGSGITHWWEKDRRFWVEYTGVAEISFDTSQIEITIDGTDVTVILPDPIIKCWVQEESFSEGSIVVEKDQWIQKNPIDSDDTTKSIWDAQEDMQETVENSSAVVTSAKMQAKELISSYIRRIGELTGVEYQIHFD